MRSAEGLPGLCVPEPMASAPSSSTAAPSLFRHRGFLRVVAAGLISQTGDWMLLIGLPFFVFELTGSTVATGAIFLAALAPPILLGSFAGVFVDRWSRTRTMVVANLLLAAGLVPLFFVHSASQLWIVYLVVVFESCVDPFFGPAEGALLPQLVGSEELLRANAIYGASRQVARLVGAAAGGLVVELGGLAGVATVDLLSFVASATLILTIAEPARVFAASAVARGSAMAGRIREVFREWKLGLQEGLGAPNPRLLLVFAMILGLGEGVFATLAAPFFVGVLGASGIEYGLLLSVQAVGGIAGGALAGAALARRHPGQVLPVSILVFAAMDAALFLYPLALQSLLPAFVLLAAVGVPASFAIAAFTTLQQTAVRDEFRGRYLGAASALMGLTMVLGVLTASVVAVYLGVIPTLLIQSIGPAVGGILLWRFYRPERAGETRSSPAGSAPSPGPSDQSGVS